MKKEKYQPRRTWSVALEGENKIPAFSSVGVHGKERRTRTQRRQAAFSPSLPLVESLWALPRLSRWSTDRGEGEYYSSGPTARRASRAGHTDAEGRSSLVLLPRSPPPAG